MPSCFLAGSGKSVIWFVDCQLLGSCQRRLTPSVNSVSSTVIQDIEAMCKAGKASMAYFYFDFRHVNKQGLRDLVASLLTQLSASSDPCCDILSGLYSVYDNGRKQPND